MGFFSNFLKALINSGNNDRVRFNKHSDLGNQVSVAVEEAIRTAAHAPKEPKKPTQSNENRQAPQPMEVPYSMPNQKRSPFLGSYKQANLPKTFDIPKSGEDYNLKLFSFVYDNHVGPLLENGIRKIESGALIHILSQGTDWEKHLKRALETGGYQFPFQRTLEQELRTIFLLRTHADDNFENLWERFKVGASQYLSEQEIDFLEKVVRTGNERMKKNTYLFPLPMAPKKSIRKGTLQDLVALGADLNSEEVKAMWKEYEKDFKVEDREDGPDLMALKELVSIVEGADVHPLSVGPGFFCKYMKEFTELSLTTIKDGRFQGERVPLHHSIIFKVKDNQLVNIQIGSIKEFKGLEGRMTGFYEGLHFLKTLPSAVASTSLAFTEFLKPEVIENKVGESASFKTHMEYNTFEEGTRYFVVVDGMVAGPSTKTEYNIVDEKKMVSLNDVRIPSGECFLYETDGSDYLSTRIYFAPYEPNQLCMSLNHGSIVFGINDWSYHSTTTFGQYPKVATHSMTEDYKAYMKNRWDNGLEYQPADCAARLHFFPRRKDGEKSEETDMFMKDNGVALASLTESMVEHNPFTHQIVSHWVKRENLAIWESAMAFSEKLAKHDLPLSHRWSVKKYFADGKGITKELQPTFYTNLRNVVESNNMKNLIQFNAECAAKRLKKANGEDY